MTVLPEIAGPSSAQFPAVASHPPHDHRGSWIPNIRMIATRFMELRKRRGLMIAMAAVNIGIPTVFLVVRLVAHAVAPKSYGPAGGYEVFTGLVAGVMYVFGFIIAATLGCTAGSSDLTEGVFRHHVATGRSRLALYFARIPAGLGIVVPMVGAGFAVVCAVCCFAAPTTLNYDGASMPAGLSRAGLETWAAGHAKTVICDFPSRGRIPVNVPCGPHGPVPGGAVRVTTGAVGPTGPRATPAQIRAEAIKLARVDYPDYSREFRSPPDSLMIKTGLWLELEATIGFIIGLGLSSLLGQRTISVVLILVLELILTPLLSTKVITHAINLQRGVVGLAMAHLEPGHLTVLFVGGGGARQQLVPESIGVAVCVVVGWVVAWTALGAWRMARRDA
jgi:hypothetical protein